MTSGSLLKIELPVQINFRTIFVAKLWVWLLRSRYLSQVIATFLLLAAHALLITSGTFRSLPEYCGIFLCYLGFLNWPVSHFEGVDQLLSGKSRPIQTGLAIIGGQTKPA
jgi:hypothetical protein